jgi:16S rRNA (guanine527-N7)-methyltransferase
MQLDPAERRVLGEFGRWLADEGVAAGGVGPLEASRIVDRHLADSLVFARVWGPTPSRVLDVGTGVGLPGIPLAITHPHTTFTLLDRSGRRCRLARRATRVLGLPNVSVEQGDVEREARTWPVVLFRASLPPVQALAVGAPLLLDDGCAVVALSRTSRPAAVPPAPPGTTVDVVQTDPGVLDSPAWLLRMRKTVERSKDGANP